MSLLCSSWLRLDLGYYTRCIANMWSDPLLWPYLNLPYLKIDKRPVKVTLQKIIDSPSAVDAHLTAICTLHLLSNLAKNSCKWCDIQSWGFYPLEDRRVLRLGKAQPLQWKSRHHLHHHVHRSLSSTVQQPQREKKGETGRGAATAAASAIASMQSGPSGLRGPQNFG